MCIPGKKRWSMQQNWHEQHRGRRIPCAISWGIWRKLWPEQDRLADVGSCYLGEEGWGHWNSWVPELSKHRLSSVYWQTLTLWAALSSVLTSLELVVNGCPWSHHLLGPWWLYKLMCTGSIWQIVTWQREVVCLFALPSWPFLSEEYRGWRRPAVNFEAILWSNSHASSRTPWKVRMTQASPSRSWTVITTKIKAQLPHGKLSLKLM